MAGWNSKELISSWSLSPGKVPGVERERNQVFKMLLNSHSVKAAMSEKVQEVFSNGEILLLSSSDYFKCPTKGVWLCKLQCWDGARGEKMWIMDGWMNGWIVGKIYGNTHKQVIWKVLLPPGEDLWRLGGNQGVRLQHVTTGKILTVTRFYSFVFLI